MNHIIKFSALVSTALISAFSSAQSNPGYLGSTQVLEVSTNWYISGLAAHGPWLKNHTSIATKNRGIKTFLGGVGCALDRVSLAVPII